MLPLGKVRPQDRTIAWLVIVSIVVLTLAPSHYHLHHGSGPDAASHEHEVDLHLLTHISDETHHQDAIVLDTTPDGLIKPQNDNPLPLLLTAFLLAFLPIVNACSRHPLFETATRLRPAFHHLTPPLRAPPRH